MEKKVKVNMLEKQIESEDAWSGKESESEVGVEKKVKANMEWKRK